MQDISYYTMGDVLGTAEFARRGRKRGSRDKKPRKRRMMAGVVAGGLGATGALGAAGRYGLAGVREMRSSGIGRPAGMRAGMRGASTQMGKDLAAVKMGAAKGARGINARSRKAVGTINNSARSVGGMLKGRKGLALAGAGAIAATAAGGVYGMARSRRRR